MQKQQALPPIRLGPSHPQGPAALITRRAADALRAGAVWVYRSDIDRLLPAPGVADVAPGALVTVLDARSIPLGTAIYSAASQIPLRLVSPLPALTRTAYLEDLRTRTEQALALRAQLAPVTARDNAHRLIFAEADHLPGIIADRYNDLIVLQLLTQATAQDDVRAVLSEALQTLSPAAIVERPDARIRILEELGPTPEAPLYAATLPGPDPKLKTTFTINGMHFAYDAAAGQKTGAFLDQRLNYAAAARYAHGKALDVCTYQGGFALHLAETCTHVTGVDTSRAALEVADANLLLNDAIKSKVAWIEADAFDLLREFDHTGRKYDTIVLDPPAFAKSKRATEGAARGYKELNLRALRMLAPDGTLVTCSCSHHVDLNEFTDIVRAAAADSRRRVQVIEARGAAPDHPAILTLPETSYLKCLICRVE